jgi:hypothetical protein
LGQEELGLGVGETGEGDGGGSFGNLEEVVILGNVGAFDEDREGDLLAQDGLGRLLDLGMGDTVVLVHLLLSPGEDDQSCQQGEESDGEDGLLDVGVIETDMTDITDIKTDITDIADIKKDIADIKMDITDMTTDIADIADITDITDITDIKKDIADMTTDIADIKKDIMDMENGDGAGM